MNVKKRIFILLSCLLTLLIAATKFTIIFDMDYDAFANNLAKMQFSTFSIKDYYYLGFVLFNNLYKSLHNFVPAINWSAFFQVLCSFFAQMLLLYAVVKAFIRYKVPDYFQLVFILFVSIVYIDFYLGVTQTRFSIILTGVALMLLGMGDRLSHRRLIVLSCIYMVGALHKPESGLGMLLFTSIGLFVLSPSRILLVWWRYRLTIIMFMAMVLAFVYDWNNTNLFERKIEPNIEYALSTGRVKSIAEMHTHEDSLRYKMAMSGMFIDEDFVGIDFLNGLINYNQSVDWLRLSKSIRQVYSLILDSYIYFIYILFFILAYVIIHTKWRVLFGIFILNGLFALLLFYTSYKTDISHRHMASFILLISCYNLLLFLKNVKYKRVWLVVFSLILSIGGINTLEKYAEKNESDCLKLDCYEEVMTNVEDKHVNRFIVLSLFNYNLLDRKLELKTTNYDKNKYLIYDVTIYSKIPPYNKYLSEICDCNPKDPYQFFKWLESVNALFVATDERYKLLETYMHEVKGKNLRFGDVEYNFKIKCVEDLHVNNFSFRTVNFD